MVGEEVYDNRRRERAAVATDDETRGQTYIDTRYDAPPPNITVVWDVDEAVFTQRLYEMCAIR